MGPAAVTPPVRAFRTNNNKMKRDDSLVFSGTSTVTTMDTIQTLCEETNAKFEKLEKKTRH